MGYATTRSLERVAAAMGALESAPIQFEPAQDVSQGGVLLALPALLATGLLRFTQQFYALPKGFYGIDSIFLLLALMALARIPSVEQLRYAAPGEWGNLLGLDRVPEVRTLRAKLELLCREAGRALRWHTALAREWIAGVASSELVFYADGHVRVYHGDLTPLPRHYVARERLCMRATTDYWIHAMDGQPFFYINKEVDPGLIATLRHDLVPFLENQVPISPARQKGMEDNPRQHGFTLVFDREAYSPELFAEMQAKRIAVLTYHKYPGEDWPEEEFREQTVELDGGAVVSMKLAERGTRLSNGLWVRQVRKLSAGGKQTAILSTDYVADYTRLAASMFARWSQENFFKYMREHYGLDRLVEYGTEAVPDSVRVVNPAWRQLDSQIRALTGQRQRLLVQFAAHGLQGELSEAEVTRYQQKKAQLQEEIEHLGKQLEQLKRQRRETAHHVTIGELPEAERFSRLLPERKHFLDTIKLISYRAETNMASLLRESMTRGDDTRALLRQIYATEADLIPDADHKTLTVRLHHLTQAAHDQALVRLCDELNATETIFPGTDLRLIYKLGSC
jgi:transposase-like protein